MPEKFHLDIEPEALDDIQKAIHENPDKWDLRLD